MPQALLDALFLHPDVHLAWCDDDIVILNVQADEYACVVDGGKMIRPGHSPGTVRVSDVLFAEEMLKAGLLCPHATNGRRSVPKMPPERALEASRSPRRRDLFGAAATGFRSKRQFVRSSMADLVSIPNLLTAQRGCAPLDRAGEMLAAFQAVQPWLPDTGECLQRAFMLRSYLHASDITTDWVFGVRTWPFLAHCWIQIDDRVVGDTVERVSGFTPILVV
ncbi:lasso peptide biosynthesis B2 protein [Brevundimonas variabilis]|uniref:Microcin J25-processing protein McjB C-terminal domain-containing protein n=1 Tax=Brevundimonas variabilis TaxID=74312 RepID=A0A7W9CHF5_9CAUL|nr:lasso peptide biosynthesis B2 protein [Brevundimonas variabilis]MBB5745715.1 hypothetical protein [Brevundimonas variabilis]